MTKPFKLSAVALLCAAPLVAHAQTGIAARIVGPDQPNAGIPVMEDPDSVIVLRAAEPKPGEVRIPVRIVGRNGIRVHVVEDHAQ